MERLLERQVDALLVYRPPAEIDDCLRLYAEAGAPVISMFAKPEACACRSSPTTRPRRFGAPSIASTALDIARCAT
jgi:hypothetical protein